MDVGQSGSKRRRGGCCNSCCACVSLLIGVILLLLLVVGGAYFAFLQSNLPEVRLRRLDVNNLQVNRTGSDTVLTGDFEVRLNMTNSNGRIELAYSPMTATISSEGINLGSMNLPAMRQRTQVVSELRVRASPRRAVVEEAGARDLQSKAMSHLMVINVVVRGQIHFSVMQRRLLGFPYRVTCRNIDQSEIDNGHAPRCAIRIRPF